jgi:gluconokinase
VQVTRRPLRMIVVMGASGAGKTTVGSALAAALEWRFVDADDFHAPENVVRMRQGIPLTDRERAPWLALLRAEAAAILSGGESLVLACSALRHSYRAALVPVGAAPDAVRFVYLNAPAELLLDRLSHREGHFAGVELLESQLSTLEEPEHALWVDARRDPADIVAAIREAVGV